MRFIRFLVLWCMPIIAVPMPYTITMQVAPYPEPQAPMIKKSPGKLELEPGMLNVAIFQRQFKYPYNIGIIGLYNGYLSVSNKDGLLVFPRTTQQENFTLVVAHNLAVIYDLGVTVKEIRIPIKEPYAAYDIQRKFDDETGTTFWEVSRSTLSKSRRIPMHTIVIHAKPDNVYVPLGITITNNQPNLFLPAIYAKYELDNTGNALMVATIRQIFAPIRRIYEKATGGYATLSTTHIPVLDL